jgi:LacI family transcriptional regulator, galactose operon repressor
MRDVAEYAGVSPMTVSRTLRDDPVVTAENRRKVHEAVAALGYRRNEAARSLRSGRAHDIIGLVVTNLANPFYSQLALGVEQFAAEHGQQVLIGNTADDVRRERELLGDFAGRRIDGVVVVPAGNDHHHLRAAGLPVVLATARPRRAALDCVLVDDYTGSRELTEELIAAGHRRIAFLGLPEPNWNGAERLRGFADAMGAAGLAVPDRLIDHGLPEVAIAQRTTRELLDLSEPPTAIVAANNRNTMGAYRAIRHARTAIALAGFDDFEFADLLDQPLTVAAYDPTRLGAAAAELLFDRVHGTAGKRRRTITIPVQLKHY